MIMNYALIKYKTEINITVFIYHSTIFFTQFDFNR